LILFCRSADLLGTPLTPFKGAGEGEEIVFRGRNERLKGLIIALCKKAKVRVI
jgi:hypothetical protein